MNVTVTIDSEVYAKLDRVLRVLGEDFHSEPPKYVAEILEARRLLGLPFEAAHRLSNYDPRRDELDLNPGYKPHPKASEQ